MTLAILIAVGGLAVLAAIISSRRLDAQAWRGRLVAYQLRPARGLTADDITAWLGTVASATRRYPVGFEVEATHKGISYFLLVPLSLETSVLTQLRSALPRVRVEEAADYLERRPAIRSAAELRLNTRIRPLAVDRAESAATALISGLYPLARGEVVRLQWLLSGIRASLPSKDDTADTARDIRAKHTTPVFNAAARLAVSAPSKARAVALTTRLISAYQVLDAPGTSILRRALPGSVVVARIYTRALPLTVWPMRLNAAELVGLLGLPLGEVALPGLDLTRARQLAPANTTPRSGTVLAHSNFSGMTERPIAIKAEDRRRHVHILGPTGSGKSWLIASMALQDLTAGSGLFLVDPKSDLVDDVLARVPEDRTEDVIVLDPSSTSQPVGFNVLQAGASEHARELVVDHVVHIFAELWRSSWGPRTSDVLRTALLTLTHTKAPDGSAFTLCEVPELLTNTAFRRFVTSQPTVPESVRGYWFGQYEQMSDGERAQVIGPSLNKLRALTTRTALRLMLGQSSGVDLSEVFRSRRVVLVPLSKGTVGTETAHLLGSLLVATLWQTTLAQAAVPQSQRRTVAAYLDEFQDVLRLGASGELTDMLDQARGLGLSLTLAHQYLGQLPKAVEAAVLGTVRSQIAFQLDHDDAKTLEKRFAPSLTAADLMGMEAHEVAARLSVDGQTRTAVTGTTLPLGEPLRDASALAVASRERYGVPRADVEAALRARVTPGNSGPRIGRTRQWGGR
ncbi:type IV secretory system conjugative DNA transfer family protein [Streptomyces broussonetiae]|uniref:DUF87 domain-containing protein n=1 Tax=Streptomyces broussonetiae TaxID=2686304 RepID=A0ABV5EJV9_9ACTN